jgi:hypothetical protein
MSATDDQLGLELGEGGGGLLAVWPLLGGLVEPFDAPVSCQEAPPRAEAGDRVSAEKTPRAM